MSNTDRVRAHRINKDIALLEAILARVPHTNKKLHRRLAGQVRRLFNKRQRIVGSGVYAPSWSRMVDHQPLTPADGYDSDPSARCRTPIWILHEDLFKQFGRLLVERRPKTATFDILFLQAYYLLGMSYQDIYEKYRLPTDDAPCREPWCIIDGCLCGHTAKTLKSKYDPKLHGTRPLQERRYYLCALGYEWLGIRKPNAADWRARRQRQQEAADERSLMVAGGRIGGGVDPIAFLDEEFDRPEPAQGNVERVELSKSDAAEHWRRVQNDPAYRRRMARQAEAARKHLPPKKQAADRRLAKARALASRGKIRQLAKLFGVEAKHPVQLRNAEQPPSHDKQAVSERFRGTAHIMEREDGSLPEAA
jgi:hypothetical protein